MTEDELKTARRKFLDDTCAHFNSSNRGIADGKCSYAAGCAIGRHLPIELAEKLDKLASASVVMAFRLIPEHLKDLGRDFLGEIQTLHDIHRYWTHEGLSLDGKARRHKIIKFYC